MKCLTWFFVLVELIDNTPFFFTNQTSTNYRSVYVGILNLHCIPDSWEIHISVLAVTRYIFCAYVVLFTRSTPVTSLWWTSIQLFCIGNLHLLFSAVPMADESRSLSHVTSAVLLWWPDASCLLDRRHCLFGALASISVDLSTLSSSSDSVV